MAYDEPQGPNSASFREYENGLIAAEVRGAEIVREMGDIAPLIDAAKTLKAFGIEPAIIAEFICEEAYEPGDVYDCVHSNIMDALSASRKGGA